MYRDDIEVTQTQRDGVWIWKMKCPLCEEWGAIDEDQIAGRISILCDCGFHETIDLTENIQAYQDDLEERQSCDDCPRPKP